MIIATLALASSLVWSCISPDGKVHVVWFDNRAGYYGDGVVETQTVELDNWRVHRAVSLDEGATWSVRANVSDEESRGGVGTPSPSARATTLPRGSSSPATPAISGFGSCGPIPGSTRTTFLATTSPKYISSEL